MTSKITFLVILSVIFASASPIQRIDEQSSRLVVFGDSFSDDGHGAWLASNGTWPPDIYYGHHFSNGPVWAQLVAGDVGLELFDYAAGGATANNSFVAGFTGPHSTIPVPSSQDQINQFRSKHTLSGQDIYVEFIGANDAFFSDDITGQEVAHLIDGQVEGLYQFGGRNILLASYPNLGALPVGRTSSNAYANFLSDYSQQLRSGLFAIQRRWSSRVNLEVVDLYPLFQDILADPRRYGFDPDLVQVACAQGVYPSEGVPLSVCSHPDKHLFWDIYHPTRVGHRIAAEAFKKAITKLRWEI